MAPVTNAEWKDKLAGKFRNNPFLRALESLSKLRDKIFFITLSCLIMTAIALSLVAGHSLKSALEYELSLRSLFLMRSFQKVASEGLKKTDKETLESFLDSLIGDADLEEARILDASGIPVASRMRDTSAKTFRPDAVALAKVLKPNSSTPVSSIERGWTRRRVMYQRAYSENDATRTLGVCYMKFSYQRLDRLVRAQIFLLIFVTLLCVVISALLAYFFSTRVTDPLYRLRDASMAIQAGNFAILVPVESQDELGDLAKGFNQMAASLRDVVAKIHFNADDVNASSQDLTEGTKLSSQMTGQLTQVVEHIAENSATVAQRTQKVYQSAKDANAVAQKGMEIIAQLVDKMSTIEATLLKAESSIGTLAGMSAKISQITNVIAKIAEQTNLLSLNAAIEAAHAGKSGSGFAVVADEIRKLAQNTAVSTREITELIRQVLEETQKAVKWTKEERAQTREGSEMMVKAREGFYKIATSVQAVSEQFSEIASSTDATAAATEEVAASVQKHEEKMQEVFNSTVKLSKTAQMLKDLANQFKIKPHLKN